ncbi:MAG: serine/threonine protein kinase [Cyanothece sp. SIO1E1]|nr:serine/threonine protein kinase [Cyanothece sp. SIO1E1]
MTVEDALALVNAVLAPQYINDVQELIFRQCWLEKTYPEIASISGYTHDHVRWIGAQLWQSLSDAFGEKITKSNFRAVLKRYQRNHPLELSLIGAAPPDLLPESFPTTAPKLELPTGPVSLDSRFYVERSPLEARCYEAIEQPGALIRIKAPRQMGKTSLMTRILHYAQNQGCQTVALSMRQASLRLFANPDRFLFWFCAAVGDHLSLPNQLGTHWDPIFGGNGNSTSYFEKYLLPELETPLVIAIDDTDVVFRHAEIATDFLGLLRAWYEKAKYGVNNSARWQKLRLVVIHSTEVYIPLTARQSPFNVGLSIELPELTPVQVKDLASRYPFIKKQDTPDSDHQNHISRLMDQVGGNPYLLRAAFYYLAQNHLTLEALLSSPPIELSIYQDILRQQWQNLQQYPELIEAYRQVVKSPQPVQLAPKLLFELQSLGLVRLNQAGVLPSCQLYAAYFSDHLDRKNENENENENENVGCCYPPTDPSQIETCR